MSVSPEDKLQAPRLQLFGRIRVEGVLTSTRPKVRRMLAMLALNIGQLVPIEKLSAEIWGQHTSVDYRSQLAILTCTLRNEMGDKLEVTNIREHKLVVAYCLEGQKTDVDVLRFMNLSDQAAREQRRGCWHEAISTLDEALALAEAPLLADVEHDHYGDLRHWSYVVERTLNTVRLRRVKLLMRAGYHEDVIDELHTMWQQNLSSARVAALLMLALYRSGDPADALRKYNTTCSALAGEHNLTPPPQLEVLSQKIRLNDPSLLDYTQDE